MSNFIIEIGKNIVTEGIGVDLVSSTLTDYDYAKLTIQEELHNLIEINNNEEVKIDMEFDGVITTLFTGTIVDIKSNTVRCKDDMIRLLDIDVNYTFVDTTPQEVVRYVLDKADISDYVIGNGIYPRRLIYINNLNGVQVLKELSKIYGLKNVYRMEKGVFYWGTQSVIKDTYQFTYGENIITLTFSGESWELTTIALPITCNDQAMINHPELTGTFAIDKVRYFNDDGFMRMTIGGSLC
ncbi:hypothetical protein [Vallitalea guaymasensis]|uniref:hypothetical protein n=1 Tax=Vallitalea guaymasensis TaxID=1185412 RepID=UPI000DE371C6|nr:hypothetical protein [Vallitalea guaymasensis]